MVALTFGGTTSPRCTPSAESRRRDLDHCSRPPLTRNASVDLATSYDRLARSLSTTCCTTMVFAAEARDLARSRAVARQSSRPTALSLTDELRRIHT